MNKRNLFAAVIEMSPEGTFTLKKAKKLVQVNQFRKTWKRINSRQLARSINNSELTIN